MIFLQILLKMASLSILKDIISHKKYCQIPKNSFQEYANKNFEDKFFKNPSKYFLRTELEKNWDIINGKN